MTKKQKGVCVGIILAILVTLIALIAAIKMDPLHYQENLSAINQLKVVLRCGLFLGFCLAIAIARMAKHRFFSPADIDGSGLDSATKQASVLQAILQNTLEQSLLALLMYVSWTTIMPGTWLSVVPMATALFVIGRLLFFMQYQKGAAARSFGFGLTFYPSMFMLIVMLGYLIFIHLHILL